MEKRIHDFLPEIKDYYTITDKGEVFSDNSGKMKTRNRAGTTYQIINFQMVDGTKKTFRLHRLVMMAFKPIDGMDELEVNHIDGNKENNCLENLEWCTSSENQQHAFVNGLNKPRKGEECPSAKLTKEDVDEIFKLRAKGLTYQQIADAIGKCTKANIYCVIKGKSWKG